MRIGFLLLVVLIATGCATARSETKESRVVNATTQIAFAAPLVLNGAFGLAGAGALGVALAASPMLGGFNTWGPILAIDTLVAVGFLTAGTVLLMTGRGALLDAQGSPAADVAVRRVRDRAFDDYEARRDQSTRVRPRNVVPAEGPIADCARNQCGEDEECKKSLLESAGEADDSVEWLREHCFVQ